jgi:membrane-bound lytic murein transglycosylase D
VAEAEPATTAPPEAGGIVAADLWERLRGNYALKGFEHPRIQHEIERLQHSPTAFSVLISRAEPFLHHIVAEVERRGLPGELALLPAVESGFRPYAYSRSGAAGLWQFMPATGAMLGLQQDWWYDGRRDVLAATQAALDYLEHLNQRLDGDWLHAIAAYNAGGGTVRRAVRKARTAGMSTTFWNLDLPRETDHYVPRLLALAEVIADPGHYGLALPSLEDRPYFASVPSGGQIDLKVAADLAQLPLEDLLALNPGFNRWSTRPDGPHHLLIPVEHAEAFSEALAQLPEKQRLRWQPHEIRSGENLGLIARRYGVSVEAIQQANGLQGHLIRAGKVLMIPLSDSVVAATSSPRLGIPRSRVRYQVRKGDSLYKIARKFQVKVADLRRWNSVDRYLQPGQRLTVFVDPTRQTL